MTESRRGLRLPSQLNDALRLAREPSAVEPSALELGQMTSKLSLALGVPLTPPAAAPPALGAAKALAATAGATLPVWKLGAWVLGGVACGVGLSGAVALGTSRGDDPRPTAAERATPGRSSTAAGAAELPPVAAPTPPLPIALPRAAPYKAASPTDTPGALVLPAEDELSLLHRAQASLGADPAQALVLGARHEREFPSGALAQEREVIRIDALVRLGRIDDATARAQRFAEEYPGSAHAVRAQQLLKKAGPR